MKFNFFLPQNGTFRYIKLSISEHVMLEQKLTFRIPLCISHEEWDEAKQRPKNIYLKKNKKLNNILDYIKVRITEYINNHFKRSKPISQRELSKEIQKICIEKEAINPENSLLYYMQTYINSKKELICDSTYKRYNVFYNLLKRFEGYTTQRLYIDSLNGHFITDFIAFGKKEEYSENTIYRSIHFVKTILNFAERKGIKTCVRELEVRREKSQKTIVTLTEEEIVDIKTAEIPQELEAARDWLLISCYTGQRFSDFMKFKNEKIVKINGRECISFTQQKTQKEITLPLHPTVLDIIKRNGNDFPKLMDIQQYNSAIKTIAKHSKINELSSVRKRIGHRSKVLKIKKWKAISSHIGRRSFATNFYGKIPTPLLMEATGHSTEKMFLRYINPVDNDRILSLSNYFNDIHNESVMK
ncbi:integrase [Chryseobacterium nematophagum]|uniref:Integrase n=1 Tax=Chryseobacterium nematophagum TaxID=2305228 RepID=A0A3M7LAP5_9FLAO|nr:site-specific integrase [Chryseobacterium nematophagum]RMZ59060.1 integrase [Chryseobacterium nematophagum]